MFTASNIANQFDEDDLSSFVPVLSLLKYLTLVLLPSNAVLSFAVELLKVKHVIVMGHYGCGGVAASMVPLLGLNPRSAVQKWILPIHQIYEASKRYGNPSSKLSL
jgi:carbonic anhydrase